MCREPDRCIYLAEILASQSLQSPLEGPNKMKSILLVDDDEVVLASLSSLLQSVGFQVDLAANVPDALRLILARDYDVLLSDLHMPAPGDGLTVISAMRQAHPEAVTLLLTSFPEMDVAASTIIRQADEILIKPMNLRKLVEAINRRLSEGPLPTPPIESVATILERTIGPTIQAWLERVEQDETFTRLPLGPAQRTCHLPDLLNDLVTRLRSDLHLGSRELISVAAHQHGVLRRLQGYTAPMLIEESRHLQVSIFETLHSQLPSIDFSRVLLDVMCIADEADSQLRQTLEGFLEPPAKDIAGLTLNAELMVAMAGTATP
jgi:CheY-like chemotaxis protein